MSESNLYQNLLLNKTVYISPSELNKNLNEIIENKLLNKYNGICIKEGYIKSDSISIIKRTIGKLDGSNFRGLFKFNIVFSADICNPVNGTIIKCVIKNINKLGLFAQDGPLSIIIPRDYHETKTIFKDLNIGDTVEVEVLGKQFQLNDTAALIIGRLSSNVVKKKFKIKKIKIKPIDNNSVEPNMSGLEEVTEGELAAEELTDNLMNDDKEMKEEFDEITDSDEDDDYLNDKEEISLESEVSDLDDEITEDDNLTDDEDTSDEDASDEDASDEDTSDEDDEEISNDELSDNSEPSGDDNFSKGEDDNEK